MLNSNTWANTHTVLYVLCMCLTRSAIPFCLDIRQLCEWRPAIFDGNCFEQVRFSFRTDTRPGRQAHLFFGECCEWTAVKQATGCCTALLCTIPECTTYTVDVHSAPSYCHRSRAKAACILLNRKFTNSSFRFCFTFFAVIYAHCGLGSRLSWLLLRFPFCA